MTALRQVTHAAIPVEKLPAMIAAKCGDGEVAWLDLEDVIEQRTNLLGSFLIAQLIKESLGNLLRCECANDLNLPELQHFTS
jgi:hypothetical protein